MNKVKKGNKKENLINDTKITINTVPSYYLTQQIRIPTGSTDEKTMVKSLELRNMPKSIQMRKSTIVCNKKKTNLRKGIHKVVKTTPSGYEGLRTITQTFKQLKHIKLSHEKYREKMKSPAFKSRSASKLIPRKKSTKINPNFNSERLLGLNLKKTIKQINMNELIQEDDSLIIKSNSSRRQPEMFYNLISQNEDSINLAEVIDFCSNFKKHKPIQFSIKNNSSFRQNRAASKIQKAWRRFQTRKLVQRNAQMFLQIQKYNIPRGSQIYVINENFSSQHQNESRQIIVKFQQQPNNPKKHTDNHINNLKIQVTKEKTEQMVEKFTRVQLERWDQIINIISLNKGCNPSDISRLLQKLTQQSENNKRSIEALACNKPSIIPKKQVQNQISQQHQNDHLKGRFQYSSSQRSIQNNQYDNKKYIDFLDADTFSNQFVIESPHISKPKKISYAKQQLLLQILKNHSPKDFVLNHSSSQKQLLPQHKIKIRHKKSISENIQIRQTHVWSTRIHKKVQKIDLDKLIQNYLDDSDLNQINAKNQANEQSLRIKIALINKIKQQYQQQEQIDKKRKRQISNESQITEIPIIVQRSPAAFSLHSADSLIEVELQQSQNQKEQYEQDFESESEKSDEINDRKYQTCATIILDKLIFQALKDIANSDVMCLAFKTYSRNKKQQKRTQPIKKKKGFSTSKAQIEIFLTNILNFLQKQYPCVFKNLEVPTGPSAQQMLRYMHEQPEEQENASNDNQTTIMIIPNRAFDAFWELKDKSIIIEIPQNIDKGTIIFRQQLQLLKSINKIFYRCLFDTFNECLDYQRNFGQYGRPFPWKKSTSFHHLKQKQKIQSSVNNARKRMMDLSTIYCGLIVQKQDLGTINEDYIKQIHEQRLNRMLTGDLLQLQDRWIFYDDEQTQILVQISHSMCTDLIIEAILDQCFQNYHN